MHPLTPTPRVFLAGYASALLRNFAKTGNTTIVKEVVPSYKGQFLSYANGTLPDHNAHFNPEADCLWNAPGNEGQEQTISGPGCRPLVQSMMYGEANALAALCDAIGDTDGAAEMATEATKWQRRVLRQWNKNLSSFDTLRVGAGPKPPPAPPVPPAPMPKGWTVVPADNGMFCCDQSPCKHGQSTFLFQGALSQEACVSKCASTAKCNFMTHSDNSWCFNSEYCNTTHPFAGGSASTVHTYAKPSAAAPATSPAASAPSEDLPFAGVRELASLSSPWFFSAIPVENATFYQDSWLTAFDPDGLGGPHGLRTAEKRHPGYYCDHGCCSWSGPVWPFESSKAITAAINVLNNYPEVTTMDGGRFWAMLYDYTAMHTPKWKVMSSSTTFYANLSESDVAQFLIEGLGELWVAENGCGDDQWTRQPQLGGPAWTDGATEGYRYNHATFMDLVLSGVVGLQPVPNGSLTVNPLVPATTLPWWAADGVALHGKIVSVVFDADGSHYNKGAGLKVLVNGVTAAASPVLKPLTVQL